MTGPFYKFIQRHVKARVSTWGEDKNYTGERKETTTSQIKRADVINSNRRRDGRHSLILDIDYPVYLAQSTNGNSHLYMDLPQGLSTEALAEILEVLGRHGVIEEGYAKASIARGYTSVRRPGRRKGRPIAYCMDCGQRGDIMREYQMAYATEMGRDDTVGLDIQDVEDWIWANEGTLERTSGLFVCTRCYIKRGMPLNSEPGMPQNRFPDPTKDIF